MQLFALVAIAFSPILIGSAAQACENAVEPNVLLGSLSSEMITTINDNLDEIKLSPSKATKIIEEVLLPHVDFVLASKMALAFIWDDLSDQQKRKFVLAFKVFLVRHSSVILADFLAGKNKRLNTDAIQIDDEYASANNIAMVKSKVFSNSSEFYRVGYRLYCDDESWRIYDVVINGVSVIKQYEGQFKFKIDRDGFDSLVTFLNYKNALLLAKVRD